MLRSRLFYGWFVAAACFTVSATMGGTFPSSGVFFHHLADEFGWNRALISSAFSFFIIGYSISALISGRLADRYSPRLIIILSGILTGLGLSLCCLTNDINEYRILNLIVGLGSGALVPVPLSTVQRWFQDRRGAALALSLVTAGGAVGLLVFPSVMNQFIASYDWRSAYILSGVMLFAIIIITSIAIKNRPEEGTGTTEKHTKLPYAGGWSIGKVLKSPVYLIMVISIILAAFVWQTMVVHFMPHAIDSGMSSASAAFALGLLGGLSIPGRLSASFIVQKLGWQKANALSFLIMGVALVWLAYISSAWMLYGFIVIFGIFNGLRVVSQWGLLSEFFGLRSVGEIIGISSAVASMVGAAGPYMAGALYDSTGSYFINFIILAALILVAGLIVWLLKKPVVLPVTALVSDHREAYGR